MDSGGFSWSMLTIVGPLVLAAVILWAVLRNRSKTDDIRRTEDATHRLYEEEERAHKDENNNVP